MQHGETSTRDRLLQAARDLYLEVGPSGFSLREVARRTELTPAAVYRHFDGKDALLDAVCQEGFRVFAAYLMEALKKQKPIERLRASGEQYLRFALERPRDYRVIFMSEVPEGLGPSPENLPATFQFLVDRVRECIEAKALRRSDPKELAVAIWGHVHGLVALRLAGHLQGFGDEAAFAKLYARSVDDLLAGLAP